MITAIYPGTYDPVTNGHVDVIRRAASIFDRIVVGVVRDPHHQQTMFSLDDRVAFLEEALASLDNVEVAPEIETMYVMSSPLYSFISSSGVKEIASFGGKVDELVPEAVARRFREMFPNGRPGAPLSPQE